MTAVLTEQQFSTEPMAVYRARAREHLTSHQLADFRRCPQLYQWKRDELYVEQDRPAYLIGQAVHSWALEGKDAFDATYCVGGPINPKTGAPFGQQTKAWAEWATEQAKIALTYEQYALVANLVLSVRSHPEAKSLLAAGMPERVVRHNYCGLPCQIRIDWFDPHRGLADLKTCDDLSYFEADARRFGYVHQLAFYRAVLREVIGLAMPVFFSAVEKKEPYRAGVWIVDPQVLSIAERENEAAIERLKRCEAEDRWPTGYEDLRLLDVI
jgi:hypothetical protein